MANGSSGRVQCAATSCISLEELLNGEISPGQEQVFERAAELLDQLQAVVADGADMAGPDPVEMASTVLRTLGLSELAPYVSRLVPEVPLWAASPPRFLAGRADAVVVEANRIALVVDWKSDVNPDTAAQGAHAAQLRDYLEITGAERGAVVYMSAGHVAWIEPRSA